MKLKAEAIEFLREILKDGSIPVCDIEAQALDRGIRWRTLRRASDDLCLVKRPSLDSAKWHWSLPSSEVSMLSNSSLAKENQLASLKQNSTVLSTSDKTVEPVNTRAKVAEKAGVSEGGSKPQPLSNSTKAEKLKGTHDMWRAYVASQNFTFSTQGE